MKAKEQHNEKNKKNHTISWGGALLVITSVAIAAPVVLASSISDTQIVKNAKVTLEKLTTAQKTVDLTKDANQKLPSTFKITSIKALNALIKGVIIVPNGVIYIPKVIETNNAEGKIDVEIKIKKDDFTDKFTFKVSGFKTMVQLDQDSINAKLAKISNSTIIANSTRLPSEMRPALIAVLTGFPKDTDGVHFRATSKIVNDETGTLTIILSATKNNANANKDITITGFKTQSPEQADQALVIAKLAKISNTTISGDKAKLPSIVKSAVNSLALIGTLTGFPKDTDGVHFKAISKIANDKAGTLTIILSAIKNSASENKEIIIRGFDTMIAIANRADIDIELAKISNTWISNNKAKLPSEMITPSIKILPAFPKTTASDVSFRVVFKTIDDWYGKLFITLIATKGEQNKAKDITITELKRLTKTQIQAHIDEAKAILDNLVSPKIVDDTKTVGEVSYNNLHDFFTKTTLTIPNGADKIAFDKVNIAINVSSSDDTFQRVKFTISSKTGWGVVAKSFILVKGFKSSTQVQAEIDEAKAILDNLDYVITTANTKTIEEIRYDDLDDFFRKITLPNPSGADKIALDKVNIVIVAIPQDDTSQMVEFYISKKGGDDRFVTIIVIGFKSFDKTYVNDYLSLIVGMTTTTTKEPNKLSSAVSYASIADFNTKTNATLNLPTGWVRVKLVSDNRDGEKIVTFIISQGSKIARHPIIVTGFKSAN